MADPKRPDYAKLNACVVDVTANHAPAGTVVTTETLESGITLINSRNSEKYIYAEVGHRSDDGSPKDFMVESGAPRAAGPSADSKGKFGTDGKLSTDAPGILNPDNYLMVESNGSPEGHRIRMTTGIERETNAMAREVVDCVNSSKPAPAASKPVQIKKPTPGAAP